MLKGHGAAKHTPDRRPLKLSVKWLGFTSHTLPSASYCSRQQRSTVTLPTAFNQEDSLWIVGLSVSQHFKTS
jgi:hypothetical protein